MNNNLPSSKSVPNGIDLEKIKNEIFRRQLVGLANDTKWNELINAVRSKVGWKPSYRSKWINGYVSEWDTRWYYHLPFPFIGVLWFDISLKSNEKPTEWVIDLVKSIGFDHAIEGDIIRIYGYGTKQQEPIQ